MTSRDQLFALVTGILRSEFDIDEEQLRPDVRIRDDLDLDSIDGIDLMARLEEETGLKVSEDEYRSIRTIDDIVRVVHARLASPAA